MAHESPISLRVVQRESTRRKLLATARTLFRTQGVESTSMEDIAHALGVGRATVYLHFAGKHVLLTALLEEDWDGQATLFERLANESKLSRRQVIAWLERVIDGMRRARGSFGIHRVALGQDPDLAPLHHEHRLRLAKILLAHGGRSGNRRPAIELEVGTLMLVAEIEYLATTAVTVWDRAQTATGVALMAGRLVKFFETQV